MKQKKTKRLTPINYNAGNIKWYQKELLAEIREMNSEVKREVLKVIRNISLANDAKFAMDASPITLVKNVLNALSKRWIDRFIDKSFPISNELVKKTQSAVDRGLLASARKASITINMQWTDAMIEKSDAIIHENVSLIRSIPEKYFTEVEGMVYRSIARGGDRKKLADEIELNFGKRHGITRRRAEFIARDQVRKTTSDLSRARQQSAGIVKGIWRHSAGGNNPRHKHVEADGKEFLLDKGLPIGVNNKYVLPGEEPNCGCFWIPVLPF